MLGPVGTCGGKVEAFQTREGGDTIGRYGIGKAVRVGKVG